jgi:hypothetical protein
MADDDKLPCPPQGGMIWLDGDEIWFSFPSREPTIEGRSYHIPGGAICFPKGKWGCAELLKVLRNHRNLWAPGNAAALIAYAEAAKSK